jgi:hypothetical protein
MIFNGCSLAFVLHVDIPLQTTEGFMPGNRGDGLKGDTLLIQSRGKRPSWGVKRKPPKLEALRNGGRGKFLLKVGGTKGGK